MTSGSMVQNVAYFNCPCIHHLSPNICNICYGITFCSIVNESNFQKQQVIFCSSILRWNNILYHRIMYSPLWLAEPALWYCIFFVGEYIFVIYQEYLKWKFVLNEYVKNLYHSPMQIVCEERTTTLQRRSVKTVRRSTVRMPASAKCVISFFGFFRFIYRWPYQNNYTSNAFRTF